MRGRWKFQKRSGSLRKVDIDATSIGSYFSHRPSGRAEVGDAALGGDAGAGQDHGVLGAGQGGGEILGAMGHPSDRTSLPPVRADGRRPDELRPIEILPGFVETAHGSALYLGGAHPRDLHRLGGRGRPSLDARAGARLGDRRVRDAAGLHRRAEGA